MKLLPIGAEFECQFPPSGISTDTRAHVWLYRISGHVDALNKNRVPIKACSLEPVSVRYRNVTSIRMDEPDMYGRTVPRAKFDGEPPSPTYYELLEKIGVEA